MSGERALRRVEPYRRQVSWEQHWEWCPVHEVDWERDVFLRPRKEEVANARTE